MNSELTPDTTLPSDTTSIPDATVLDFAADEINVNIDTEDSGTLTSLPTARATDEQWKQIGERVSGFLADLPDYLTDFFGEYRRPIVTIGLVLGSIVAVKLVLAILDSVNDIPLLSPTFELIGLGYSAWFIYRYLLRASNRKELSDDFTALKEQILGRNTPKI